MKKDSIDVQSIVSEIQKYEKEYQEKLYDFLTGAYELVELSEDQYQVEKSIRLNKISLKDYILRSELCVKLKGNNIENYSTEELKQYMAEEELLNFTDMSSYRKALELYELLEEIEKIETEKIDFEIQSIQDIIPDIKKIYILSKEEYQNLYQSLQIQTFSPQIIYIINEIFRFYIYGNQEIPINR